MEGRMNEIHEDILREVYKQMPHNVMIFVSFEEFVTMFTDKDVFIRRDVPDPRDEK